ncbi:MAG: serine hydrolase domain-containing protein [Caulobacterales bacterium]
MKPYAWTAVAAACLMIPVSSSAAVSQARRIARIEAHLAPPVTVRGRPVVIHTLAEEMAAHHTPSVSIAVVDHGSFIWARAYGLADVATGRKATTRTLFQAGSISKPVAASGAMTLIQQGRLALDVPANSQLTSWQIPENAFTKDHPVTLRHLLTHTAGTTVHGFPGYTAGAPVPSVVQVLEGKPPANTAPVVVERQPGTLWNYSGGGITIAQLMMTDATHQPFPDLMRRRVLTPAGMADSTYEQPLPAGRADAAATGYLRTGAAVEGRFHTYPEMAAAGLWTTPTDLARWAIALEQAYHGASRRLMSRASAKAMLTPGLGHWGLGVEVGGSGEDFHFTHGGDDAGFKANLMAWPSGSRVVVAMANGDDGAVVVSELMQAVAREYGWRGLEPRVIESMTLSEAQIKEIAGGYGHGLVVISADGPALGLTYGGVRVELIPQAADQFIADPAGANIPVALVRGPDGKVKSLSAQGLTIPRDP